MTRPDTCSAVWLRVLGSDRGRSTLFGARSVTCSPHRVYVHQKGVAYLLLLLCSLCFLRFSSVGVRLWDLGMELEYKRRLGAEMVRRSVFLRAFREARSQPPGPPLNMATVVRLLDESARDTKAKVEDGGGHRITKSDRKRELHAEKMRSLQKPRENKAEAITSCTAKVQLLDKATTDQLEKNSCLGVDGVSGKGFSGYASSACSSPSVFPPVLSELLPRSVVLCERSNHLHSGCRSRTAGPVTDKSFPRLHFHVVNCDSLVNLYRRGQRDGQGRGN